MRDGQTFRVWEEALRFVRERDIDGYAEMFAPDGVVQLPFPLPGMPPRLDGRQAVRQVLAPVWRAQKEQNDTARRIETVGLLARHPVQDPEIVVIEFDAQGFEASGIPYRLSYLHLVTVREGRIAPPRDPVDTNALRDRLHSSDEAQNKSLVMRYFGMVSSGDFGQVEHILAARYADHAHPEIVGPAAVATAATRILAGSSGTSVAIDTLVGEGELVAARTTMRQVRGGEAIVTSGMAFFRVREGKLVEQWSCYPRAA
jgi:ketosteroid isomerase-like protein